MQNTKTQGDQCPVFFHAKSVKWDKKSQVAYLEHTYNINYNNHVNTTYNIKYSHERKKGYD